MRNIMAKRGFSLIELSVVLGIIAAVTGGAIMLFTVSLEGRAAKLTQARIATIKQLLKDYRIANHSLPCPADITLQLSNNNFGIAADPSSTCGGGTPAATIVSPFYKTAYGMVPTRTLGLPDEAAFDGWGRRIVYAVFTDYTVLNGFDSVAITTTDGLQVTGNGASTPSTESAAFVIISHGKNGHGARSAVTAAIVSSASAQGAEQSNCKCSTSGAYSSSGGLGNTIRYFYRGDEMFGSSAPQRFDDIVEYATRAELRGPNE